MKCNNSFSVSLTKNYYIIMGIIFLSVFLVSGLYCLFSYQKYRQLRIEKLSEVSEKIQEELNTIFDESYSILQFLGEKISTRFGSGDLKNVADILENTGNLNLKSMADSYVSWATVNGKIVVAKKGILKNSLPDISDRHYFLSSRESPWTLQFSAPTFSVFSHSSIVPLAMGVTDENNKFIGYLIFSLKEKFIKKRLYDITGFGMMRFIIFDEQSNIIFDNYGIKKTVKNSDFLKVMERLKQAREKTQPFRIDSISYRPYKKINHYPYYILAGLNEEMFNEEFFYYTLPSLCVFLLTGIFFAIVLLFFKRKILTPIITLASIAMQISKGNTNVKIYRQPSVEMNELAKSLLSVLRYIKRSQIYKRKMEEANRIALESDKAREGFIKILNRELSLPLREISVYSTLLIESLTYRLDISLTSKQLINFLEKIKNASECIRLKTRYSLNPSYFKLKNLITESIKINLKNAYSKNIKIANEFVNDEFLFYGDELKFKQILASILYQSIESLPKNSEITIATSFCVLENVHSLKIMISDRGFGLTENELDQIQNNLGLDNEDHFFEFLILETEQIKYLVEEHHGKLYSKTIINEGKTVILEFPILNENDFNYFGKKNKNVISSPLFSMNCN